MNFIRIRTLIFSSVDKPVSNDLVAAQVAVIRSGDVSDTQSIDTGPMLEQRRCEPSVLKVDLNSSQQCYLRQSVFKKVRVPNFQISYGRWKA